MEIREYTNKKLQIQNEIYMLLSNDQAVERLDLSKLNEYLDDQKIHEDENEFKAFFNLLNNIFCNHHRSSGFIDKIKKILFLIKDDFPKYYTDSELFLVFNKSFSKRILLFLIENQLFKINYFISDIMKKQFEEYYLVYFFNELKPFLDIDEIKRIENKYKDYDFNSDIYYQNRKIGENEHEICKIIRNDIIVDFISYVNRTNFPLDGKIEKSIYETNPLLVGSEVSLIEYAAFFGSIQIFKYLQLNHVEFTPSLWIFAIHGNNAEILYILEESNVKPDDETYKECLDEAIKCFHDEIADYFIQEKEIQLNDIYIIGLSYYNYKYFPNNLEGDEIFFNLCKYGHFFYVEKMLQNRKNIDLNFKMKTKIFYYFVYYTPLNISIDNNHANIVEMLLKFQENDLNDKIIEFPDESLRYYRTGLEKAIFNDNFKIVKLLIDKNIDVNASSYDKSYISYSKAHIYDSSPIFCAINKQNIDIIKLLLSHPKINVNKCYSSCLVDSQLERLDISELYSRKTILHEAIQDGNLEIVKLLLDHENIDVNILSFYSQTEDKYYCEETPLYNSIREKKDEIAKLLLSHPKINVNLKSHIQMENTEINETALNLAIRNGNIEIVKLLLTFPNIKINSKSHSITNVMETKETLLNSAVRYENVETVKLLLEIPDIDVNKYSTSIRVKKDDFNLNEMKAKCTALHTAILQGNYEIVSILLSHKKIDINKKAIDSIYPVIKEWNALMIAIENDHQKIAELLLSHSNINVNTVYIKKTGNYLREEKSALYLSIEKGFDKIVNLLLSHKEIDVNFISTYTNDLRSENIKITTLHKAFEKGDSEIIQLLLSMESIDVNMKSINIRTDEKNKFLEDEKTTLEYAINLGNQNIIQLLLANEGLDFKIKSKVEKIYEGIFVRKYKSPLEIAKEKKNPTICQLLLNYYKEKGYLLT